jgi:hypothetical protein
MGVQEVKWKKEELLELDIIFSSVKKETKIINCEQSFVHHRIVSAVKLRVGIC